MSRPIQAIIHSAALRGNLGRVRAAAPGAQVWAVVKANAYGHGIERVYAGLNGADGFALLDLAEARRLREVGWRGPILLLQGAFEPGDVQACIDLKVWHVIHRGQQLEWLQASPDEPSQHVFLMLNSGMNRLGFAPEEFRAVHDKLKAMPQVGSVTLMTHFSDADRDQGLDAQWGVFERATGRLQGKRSVCNSAATLRHGTNAEIRGDWVRTGIALYGGSPDYPAHDAAHWGLQPAMSLRAEVIATHKLAPGASVGYGSTFTAEHAMRVGTVACGYGDGYPRHAGSGTPVLVDGVRTRTLGRVSMDMLAVDLDPILEAGVGSEVTLWGESSTGAVLSVDEVVWAAGTIGYELLCALAQRVPVRVED